MDHFAGLDVSVKETSICSVDDTGRIVREVRVASEPGALLQVLGNPAYRLKRVGLEAGPLSQWLFSALAEAGLPAICVETRHMRAVLQAQINKTDRNDARGMAQMMRVNLFRPVHVKTLASQSPRQWHRIPPFCDRRSTTTESVPRRASPTWTSGAGEHFAMRIDLARLIQSPPRADADSPACAAPAPALAWTSSD